MSENNSILSLLIFLQIGSVVIFLLYKLYLLIRTRFNVRVNCWFCNQYYRVLYEKSNCWTCPGCDQYNGFTKDGDYNREIYEQLNCDNVNNSNNRSYHGDGSPLESCNGFCDGCNEAQRLKVEKLAQFQPKKESKFEQEIKIYKAELEAKYRLCQTCERHLKRVLREKKKMVLGAKFLDLLQKGTQLFRQTHLRQLRLLYRQQWKYRINLFITILSVINAWFLYRSMPILTRDSFMNIFGEFLGHHLFMFLSHFIALWRVCGTYVDALIEMPIIVKSLLFCQSIFKMLIFSLGLQIPTRWMRTDFANILSNAYPFILVTLAFGYHIMDRFKVTRFTFLMAVWSTLSSGFIYDKLWFTPSTLKFIASLITFFLSSRNHVDTSPKLHDDSANSFHKMYSDNYFSDDDDDVSMLSQQLNSSKNSTRSFKQAPSYGTTRRQLLTKSPITSSALSLNNIHQERPHSRFSPNSSFKSFCNDDNQSWRSHPTGAGAVNTSRLSYYQNNNNNNLLLRRQRHEERPQSTAPYNDLDGTVTMNNHNNSFYSSASYEPNSSFNDNNLLRCAAPKHHHSFADYTGQSVFSNNGYNTNSNRVGNSVGLKSPFSSLSSNSIFQPSHATYRKTASTTNLLSPSRFSTNCLSIGAPSTVNSWLSGGYFNQQPIIMANQLSSMYGRRGNAKSADLLMTNNENLSRSSSQSSGFESQNGPLSASREGSYIPNDATELQQQQNYNKNYNFQPLHKSTYNINNNSNGGNIGFREEFYNNSEGFSPRNNLTNVPQYATDNNFMQTLNVKCSSNDFTTSSTTTATTTKPQQMRNLRGGDSFNLRSINEEIDGVLPTIVGRGALLKKWQQTQANNVNNN